MASRGHNVANSDAEQLNIISKAEGQRCTLLEAEMQPALGWAS